MKSALDINRSAAFGCYAVLLLSISAIVARAETDYERALRAYDRGEAVVARLYFESILDDPNDRPNHASALYFLAKLSDQEGDFVACLSAASRFLVEYKNDLRTEEIFSLLMDRIVSTKSYYLALEYLKKYDYLARNDPLLGRIARGLLEQGEKENADYVLSLCPQTDTIKIIRATLKDDLGQRERIFLQLEIPSRNLYLTENSLLMGDTISAFLRFQEINSKDLSADALYRYTKLSLLFDRIEVGVNTARLRKYRDYQRKADLLAAIARCDKDVRAIPEGEEEVALCMQLYRQEGVAKEPPEDLVLDSLLRETNDTLGLMHDFSESYDNSYYVDSMYCQILIERDRYDDASRRMSPYLKYCNARPYVRKVLGLQSYVKKDYAVAANHIIMSGYRSPSIVYLLAECLRHLNLEAGRFYRQVISESADSTLHLKALRGYVMDRYAADDFRTVCAIERGDLQGDTSLVRMYARSLMRCGRKELADSVYYSYFSEPDPLSADLYGQYLIEQEQYDAALAYYDSLTSVGGRIDDGTYYNWALTAFLKNEMGLAYERFTAYLKTYPQSSRTHDAFFKMATLNYLNERYDSAAYYYGLASADDALMTDALRNQLISYKKAGNWPGVISTGREILASGRDMDEADVLFDVGYAYLRMGQIKEAVETLLEASRTKSDPRFYYWLGEAYFGKGDFARAYQSFRRIIDDYGDDEMWAPTAYYKTGIVLEFMDEIDAARAVYEQIIRQRGVADPIGAEANTRLKQIQE